MPFHQKRRGMMVTTQMQFVKLLSLANCFPASGTQFITSKHLLIINSLLGSFIADKKSLEFKVQNSKKIVKFFEVTLA